MKQIHLSIKQSTKQMKRETYLREARETFPLKREGIQRHERLGEKKSEGEATCLCGGLGFWNFPLLLSLSPLLPIYLPSFSTSSSFSSSSSCTGTFSSCEIEFCIHTTFPHINIRERGMHTCHLSLHLSLHIFTPHTLYTSPLPIILPLWRLGGFLTSPSPSLVCLPSLPATCLFVEHLPFYSHLFLTPLIPLEELSGFSLKTDTFWWWVVGLFGLNFPTGHGNMLSLISHMLSHLFLSLPYHGLEERFWTSPSLLLFPGGGEEGSGGGSVSFPISVSSLHLIYFALLVALWQGERPSSLSSLTFSPSHSHREKHLSILSQEGEGGRRKPLYRIRKEEGEGVTSLDKNIGAGNVATLSFPFKSIVWWGLSVGRR